MKLQFLIILILFFLLQASVTTIPLVLIAFLITAVFTKQNFLFPLAFFIGILLDIFTFKTPGVTSFYFMIFLFLVLLYQKKFEIETIYFVSISSFLGSLGFLLLLNYGEMAIAKSVAVTFISTVLFIFLKRINNTPKGLNYG
jgi:cell shape-determining protein MreD